MFNVEGRVDGVEFRGYTEKTTKKGEPFTLARFEDSAGYNVEFSARTPAAIGAVRLLKKGDICNIRARFVSMRDYSFISLLDVESVGNAYED